MNDRPTTLERAYQLARTGDYTGASEIKAKLKSEGYGDAAAQLYGQTITNDLRRLSNEAKAARAPAD